MLLSNTQTYIILKHTTMEKAQSTNSLFTITQSLGEIFDKIEDAGGEITPEIEEELSIRQEELEAKCASYVSAIKYIEQEINACKEEKQRIDQLKKRDENRIVYMKRSLKDAVTMFGQQQKSGSYKLKAGLNQLSVSRSSAIIVDKDMLDFISRCASQFLVEYFGDRSVDEYDANKDRVIVEFVDYVNSIIRENTPEGEEVIEITEDELGLMKVEYKVECSMYDFMNNTILASALSTTGELTNCTGSSDVKDFIKEGNKMSFAKKSDDTILRIS